MTYKTIAVAAAVACAAFVLFMLIGVAVIEISHHGLPTHFQ